MKAEEIREKFNPELCKSLTELSESYWNRLAIELLCQLAETNELQKQMIDAITGQTEELAAANEIAQSRFMLEKEQRDFAMDPQKQAKHMVECQIEGQKLMNAVSRIQPVGIVGRS